MHVWVQFVHFVNKELYELSPMIAIVGGVKEYVSGLVGLDKDRWIRTFHVK